MVSRRSPAALCCAVLLVLLFFAGVGAVAGGGVGGVGERAKVEKSERGMSFYKSSREKWQPGPVRLRTARAEAVLQL